MQCRHCNSEWKSKDDSSISVCPFCGKSLIEEGESKFYENSKDALAAIMKRFGADILLGKLSAHFSDLAPSVPQSHKKLVYAVHENGASKVLKENMDGTQEDKESAVKLAVRKLTEAYIAEEAAETIIHEFAAALGWKVNKPVKPVNNADIQSDDKNRKFNIVLKSFDDNKKVSLVRRVKELSSIDLKEAKDLVERAPCIIMKGVSKEQAVEIIFFLTESGGVAEMQNQDQPVSIPASAKPQAQPAQEKRPAQPEKTTGTLTGRGYGGTWTYTGDILNGKPHGKGKYAYANGDVYEGDWVDGKRHGKGKHVWSDGDFYEGDWFAGEKHGKGKQKSYDVFYEGDWVRGVRKGKGKMTYSDGTVEEGRFENGKYIG